jgi:hypothetical protein
MTTLRCQCCGEALLPTARALVCAACHHSATIRHCRVYCALHDQEIDPTCRAPIVATATANVATTDVPLSRARVEAIVNEWLSTGARPRTFHTRTDVYDHG